jgi:hypoxanthine-DNA glycosylase
MILKSFQPISTTHAKILILGSMPSVKSLEQHQYYGHPRNAFWKIMAQITRTPMEASYTDRCANIKKTGIALWDVIGACIRPGSLDADIQSESIEPNDVLSFVRQHQHIKCIALNGGAAFKLFKKHFLNRLPEHLDIFQLPSTSPAYTMPLAEKSNIWLKTLQPYL